MSNTLLIHIGTPKTGTSAIQKFLADNADALKKFGWCYPNLWNDWYMVNIGKKSDFLRNGTLILCSMAEKWPKWKKDVLWKIVKNYLKHYNVILSEEGFWSYSDLDFLEGVKELKSRYDNIKVVCYLRRQDLYIESKWNQKIKTGFFSKDVSECYETYKEEFDYKKRLGQLSELFGKENIIVRVYEEGQFVGTRGDITSDFLESCGIESEWNDVILPGHVNERIDSDALGVISLFNEEYSNLMKQAGMDTLRHGVVIKKYFRKFKLNEEHVKKGYISTELRKSFLEKYAKDSEYIAREYLGREDGKLFYKMNLENQLYDTPSFSEREKQIIKLFAGIIAEQEKQIITLQKGSTTGILNKIIQMISGIVNRIKTYLSFRKLKFK